LTSAAAGEKIIWVTMLKIQILEGIFYSQGYAQMEKFNLRAGRCIWVIRNN